AEVTTRDGNGRAHRARLWGYRVDNRLRKKGGGGDAEDQKKREFQNRSLVSKGLLGHGSGLGWMRKNSKKPPKMQVPRRTCGGTVPKAPRALAAHRPLSICGATAPQVLTAPKPAS